jgi:hypothetical protein
MCLEWDPFIFVGHFQKGRNLILTGVLNVVMESVHIGESIEDCIQQNEFSKEERLVRPL